jgi:pyruvate carboxylase
MGLGDRWQELIIAYQDANELFGDIIKVTPSSKVVGDMALFMLTNDLHRDNFYEKAGALSFPDSVKGMLKGQLGKPHGGFPKKISETILKNEAVQGDDTRVVIPPVDLEKEKEKLRKKFGVRKSGFIITDYHVMSSIMYPQVTADFLQHKRDYGDTYLLPTPVFLHGLKLDEEIVIHLEKGKTLYIVLLSISEPGIDGYRTVFFELNGHLRDVRVLDKSAGIVEKENVKADPENLHHLGSPIPGRVVQVMFNPGDAVKEGDTLLVLEAMKMESSITAPRDTNIGKILVKPGDTVEATDLLIEFK